MSTKYKRVLVIGSLLALIFSGVVVQAKTSEPTVSVAPFLQTIQLNGQTKVPLKVSFSNDSDQTEKLILSVADFGSLDESGGVAFVGSQSNQISSHYKLSPWLKLSTTSLSLAPHQAQTVKATIINSTSMGPGGHYGAIVGTLISADNQKQNSVTLNAKVSSLVFVTQSQGAKYNINLESIDPDGNIFKLPSNVLVTIKATGNVHIVPRGIVYLKDGNGNVIKRGAINQESGYVLPGTTRLFNVPLIKVKSPKPWSRGFYIQVDYRYDGIDSYASQKINLSYVSLWLVLLVVIIVAVLIWLFRRRGSGKPIRLNLVLRKIISRK